MTTRNAYLIDFGGLDDGIHEFEFHVDDSFFARFENSVVRQGEVDILVTLEKEPGLLLMDFTISGSISTICDRCLDSLVVPIEGFNELIVRIGEEVAEEPSDVDMITIPAREHVLDISELMFEYISLQVPLRNVHVDDENGKSTCNSDVLREMEKHLSQDSPSADPRWDVLKNINLN